MIEISTSSHKVSSSDQQASLQLLNQFLQRKEIGFPDLPNRESLWSSTESLAKKLRLQFTDLVIVGIGGSALGPRVIADLFSQSSKTHRLHFCDNVDPQDFSNLFFALGDLKKTCWAIISKSGSTIETLTATDFIIQRYKKNNLNFYEHAVVVSENKENPLTTWAIQNNIPQLEIPLDVGGRFSVLSPVGMLPAAFLGLPIKGFRDGAQWSLNQKEIISQVMAQVISSYQREEWITFFWFYSSGLKNFGGWLQQLWAESLGKKWDRQGQKAPRASTPFSAIGACDQHSVLQQVMEGAKDKFVIFNRVNALENSADTLIKSDFSIQKIMLNKKMGQLLGTEGACTQQALMSESVSTLLIKIQDQGPESVAAYFMFWQLVVAGLGEYLKINAFDQPGVELGKRLTKESLSTYN
jgi:glucose-6-phosphate isomerase